jgi:hypothetical protein
MPFLFWVGYLPAKQHGVESMEIGKLQHQSWHDDNHTFVILFSTFLLIIVSCCIQSSTSEKVIVPFFFHILSLSFFIFETCKRKRKSSRRHYNILLILISLRYRSNLRSYFLVFLLNTEWIVNFSNFLPSVNSVDNISVNFIFDMLFVAIMMRSCVIE